MNGGEQTHRDSNASFVGILSAFLIALILLLRSSAAEAHKPSDSYLTMRADGSRIEGQWDIALRDLDYALGLDADGDGAITWGEVRAHHQAIAAYALSRLRIAAGGAVCPTRATEQLFDRHSDGAYTVLRFAVDCARQPAVLDVDYSLLFDVDAQHRGVARIVSADGERTLLFTSAQPHQRIELAAAGAWQTSRDFWREGMRRVWTGPEHLLFLLTLLMPVALRRRSGRWSTADDSRSASIATLKVVSAFAVAHSITLSLAALGVLHLSPRLVASGVAASIAIAALDNAWPILGDGRWSIAFLFGLVHGFGFASALADPGLPGSSLAPAVLGFNAGIESGQLVIVAAFLPFAFAARHSRLYRRVTLAVASSLIAAVAVFWFLERAFDLRFLVS